MKTPEEYWKELPHASWETIEPMLRQIQIDAYNKAIDDAAKALRKLSYPSSTKQEQESILKLKK